MSTAQHVVDVRRALDEGRERRLDRPREPRAGERGLQRLRRGQREDDVAERREAHEEDRASGTATLAAVGLSLAMLDVLGARPEPGFAALTLTDVKRCFTLFYKGHVRAVLPDYTTYAWDEWQDIPVQPDDDVVTTPNLVLKVPRVIQLLSCDRSPRARGEVLAPQHLHARREPLPVLRQALLDVGALARPRDPALAGRPVELGERRLRLPALQRAEGQPPPRGGRA